LLPWKYNNALNVVEVYDTVNYIIFPTVTQQFFYGKLMSPETITRM